MRMQSTILAGALLFCGSAFAAGGDPAVGKKKSEPCKACHGEAGMSASPEFPNLAGQDADYLAAVLAHYKNGKRKNPIMQGQAANLSVRDINDLAAYYGSLPGLAIRY